jgi:RNA polymerase sigma factor (sigma-70 family)
LFIFTILTLGAEKVARSTAEAFAQFYEQYLPKVFRYVSYRITDKATAEDLTSVVFEKALTKFTSYDSAKASFATWVFTIARNTLTDHFRMSGKDRAVLQESAFADPAPAPSPEDEIAKEEEYRTLQVCLGKLSSSEREIISLKFGADMTNRQIAGMTGLSESNVGVILYRTVRKLRDDFKGRHDG